MPLINDEKRVSQLNRFSLDLSVNRVSSNKTCHIDIEARFYMRLNSNDYLEGFPIYVYFE